MKFDTDVPRPWALLVMFQSIALIAVISFFLFQQHTLSVPMQWTIGGVVPWWVMELGVLMNGQRWALVPGLIRSTALIAATATFSPDFPSSTLLAVVFLLMIMRIRILRTAPQHVGASLPGRMAEGPPLS